MGLERRTASCPEKAMDNRIPPLRPDVVTVETVPRPTASPPRVPFAQVLGGSARALVSGAQAAIGALPGSPLIALALRNGNGGVPTSTALDVPVGQLGAGGAAATSPEGPGGAVTGMGSGIGAVGTATDGTGIEGTLAQSQQLSLYYLQVQEHVNEQNRTFTALSNVLEVEHSTAKTAIGNIH
jgi:hypothetical protein